MVAREGMLLRPKYRFTPLFSVRTLRPMSSTVNEGNRLSGQPVTSEESFSHRKILEAALRRSQDYLFNIQRPEGFWVGELMVDSTLVSDTIAYHHWNGKVDPEWQRKAVNHILSMQLPDGGWNIYYGGPAEVNATIKAYLALKLAGVRVTDKRMLKAREVA
jgi:squalene-hopene/tetraprenyl-beta-curcumene cyclase